MVITSACTMGGRDDLGHMVNEILLGRLTPKSNIRILVTRQNGDSILALHSRQKNGVEGCY
jgi:hypothetical protein